LIKLSDYIRDLINDDGDDVEEVGLDKILTSTRTAKDNEEKVENSVKFPVHIEESAPALTQSENIRNIQSPASNDCDPLIGE